MGRGVRPPAPPRGLELACRLRGAVPPREGLLRFVRAVLKELGMPGASLGLLLCGDRSSKSLNRRFRGQDRPTDILSFPALPGRPPRGFDGYLGDLALNWPYVERKFPRFAGSLEAEAGFLLIHGILHLSGLHHDDASQEKRMWLLQNRIFSKTLKEGRHLRFQKKRHAHPS